MLNAVGIYVIASDKDKQGGPWYNGALSSFRAFGLLIAMIAAIKAAAQASMPAARYIYVAGQLDKYLTTTSGVSDSGRATVGIMKRGGGLVMKTPASELLINDVMFIKVTTP